MTVKELKEMLERFNDNATVEFTLDGYTDSTTGFDHASLEVTIDDDLVLSMEK